MGTRGAKSTMGKSRKRQFYPRWNLYDIHHIIPRQYGGTNAFENLVPVLRDVHQ
ncbi:MAG: HNH endonuclease [Chloroflexota bacterium]